MPSNRVGTRLLGSGKAVVDVLPVVWTGVGGLHAKRLDLIDQLQDALDFGPTVCAQQNLTPGATPGMVV